MMTSARGIAFISVIGACVGLIVVFVNNRQEEPTPPPKSEMTIQGFHTALHDDEDRLHIRVSGDSLTLSKARLWGPFRLGFAHSLIVRNLRVEIFSDSAADPSTRPLSVKQTWASIMPSLIQRLQSLSLQNGGGVIVSARLSPVQIIEQRPDRTRVLLKAASCKTARALASLVCTDGFVRVGEQDRPFQKWRPDLLLRERQKDREKT